MQALLIVIFERLRASFWFLPELMVMMGLALGYLMPMADAKLRGKEDPTGGDDIRRRSGVSH